MRGPGICWNPFLSASQSVCLPPLCPTAMVSFSLWFTVSCSPCLSLSAPLLLSLFSFSDILFQVLSVSHFLPVSVPLPLSERVLPLVSLSGSVSPHTTADLAPRGPPIVTHSRQGQGLGKAEAQRWAVRCPSSLAGTGRGFGEDPSLCGPCELGHLCPCALSQACHEVGDPASPSQPPRH